MTGTVVEDTPDNCFTATIRTRTCPSPAKEHDKYEYNICTSSVLRSLEFLFVSEIHIQTIPQFHFKYLLNYMNILATF